MTISSYVSEIILVILGQDRTSHTASKRVNFHYRIKNSIRVFGQRLNFDSPNWYQFTRIGLVIRKVAHTVSPLLVTLGRVDGFDQDECGGDGDE